MLCAVFMFTPILSAQESNASGNSEDSQVGAQGTSSFAINAMYNIPSVDSDHSYGLTFEALGGKYVAKNLSIEGGLGVYHSGCVYTDMEFSSTALGIPVNIGYTMPFTESGLTGLRFYTGPKLALTIAGKGEMMGKEYKISDMKDFKRFNAYWTFGANFSIYTFGITAEYMVLLGEKTDFSSGAFCLGLTVRL